MTSVEQDLGNIPDMDTPDVNTSGVTRAVLQGRSNGKSAAPAVIHQRSDSENDEEEEEEQGAYYVDAARQRAQSQHSDSAIRASISRQQDPNYQASNALRRVLTGEREQTHTNSITSSSESLASPKREKSNIPRTGSFSSLAIRPSSSFINNPVQMAPVSATTHVPTPDIITTRSVHFEWPHEGFDVKIVGTFNGWNPIPMKRNEFGVFSIDLPLLPGTHQFKFIVDGRWCFDVGKPHQSDQHGNTNNIAKVI